MMMSMDFNIPKLIQSEVNEIRSFHFYRLINPKHQDLMLLGKRLNICPDPAEGCRLVSPLYNYTYSCLPPSNPVYIRLDLQSALLYDCLLVVAYGIMAMDYSQGLDTRNRVSCAQEKVIKTQVLINIE
jgi:hypothetical protein